jgi:uncharacterized protein YdcH (DUF465 family)
MKCFPFTPFAIFFLFSNSYNSNTAVSSKMRILQDSNNVDDVIEKCNRKQEAGQQTTGNRRQARLKAFSKELEKDNKLKTTILQYIAPPIRPSSSSMSGSTPILAAACGPVVTTWDIAKSTTSQESNLFDAKSLAGRGTGIEQFEPHGGDLVGDLSWNHNGQGEINKRMVD